MSSGVAEIWCRGCRHLAVHLCYNMFQLRERMHQRIWIKHLVPCFCGQRHRANMSDISGPCVKKDSNLLPGCRGHLCNMKHTLAKDILMHCAPHFLFKLQSVRRNCKQTQGSNNWPIVSMVCFPAMPTHA